MKTKNNNFKQEWNENDFVAIVDDKVEFFVKSNETENYKQIKL